MHRGLGRAIALAATLAATAMLGATPSASATGTCQLGHCVDVAAGPSGAGVTVDGNNIAYVATCEPLCAGHDSVGVSVANGTAGAQVLRAPTLASVQVTAAGHNVTVYRAFGGMYGGSVDGQPIGPVPAGCPPLCN